MKRETEVQKIRIKFTKKLNKTSDKCNIWNVAFITRHPGLNLIWNSFYITMRQFTGREKKEEEEDVPRFLSKAPHIEYSYRIGE